MTTRELCIYKFNELFKTLNNSIEDIHFDNTEELSSKIENSIYNYAKEQSLIRGIHESIDDKNFKRIYVNKIISLYNNMNPNSYIKNNNFIKQIKDIENSSEIDLKGAEIIGSLFEINDEGKAKFIVEKINGIDKRDKPDFKNINQIQTSELTDEWRTMCYLSGAKRRKLQITGDLSKKNGKAAKVIVGKLDFYEPLESPNLFN